MHGICDSCEESSDSLFDLTRLSEFRDVVRRLNYRKVCEVCYDDLYEELKQQQALSVNRRADERYQLRLRVNVEGTDREGQKFSEETFTQDVSLTGLRIVTRQDVEVGSVLNFNLPDHGLEAAVIVELIWQDEGSLTAGLKLAEVNESWTKLILEQAISLSK